MTVEKDAMVQLSVNQNLTPAVASRRKLIYSLHERKGLSFALIGEMLGIRRQRAHQLFKKHQAVATLSGR